jgi:ribosomal protein S18 acetylase RimI-like enzyme
MTVRALQRGDRPFIERLLHETQVFTEAEIACALELIDIYLNAANQRDYLLFCAVDHEDHVFGYVCFGPTPLTDAVWDLYWIAVSPEKQKRGIGKLLLSFVETHVRAQTGRRLIIETSSLPRYEPTRIFYERHGYRELARIADFYAIGDDRIIYGKDFSPSK